MGVMRPLLALCQETGSTLATAESCTGGLLAAALTDFPGASAIFDGGFITYSNTAKTALLGVDPQLILQHGAVSEPVAIAMAEGALRAAPLANLALSTTGIAGPSGGSAAKPIGTVYLGLCSASGTRATKQCHFSGNRQAIREQTVEMALNWALNHLKETTR